MPLDTRIPLQATGGIDLSSGINALSGAFQYRDRQKERKEEMGMRREEFALRKSEAEAGKELREAQLANERFKGLTERNQWRVKSGTLAAAQVLGHLEAGDVAGAESFLQDRKSLIEKAKAIFPDLDTEETDRAIAELRAGVQAGDLKPFMEMNRKAVKFGQMIGVLQKPEKADGFTLGEGQKRFDAEGKPIASVAPASKLLSADELKQKMDIAAAGKSNVSVKVDAKMGESFAKEIGPMMTESRSAAQGALQAIDTVKRIRTAVEGGNVSLGPTATVRQNINQFAQVLGAAGDTTEEKLVNTRNVIRGLSQLALSARKQLKGQGQVSDYEGRLIQRAEAGEINDFTLPELKDFIGVTERMASKVVKEHKRTLEVMKQNANVAQFVPFYDVGDDQPEVNVGRFKVKVK